MANPKLTPQAKLAIERAKGKPKTKQTRLPSTTKKSPPVDPKRKSKMAPAGQEQKTEAASDQMLMSNVGQYDSTLSSSGDFTSRLDSGNPPSEPLAGTVFTSTFGASTEPSHLVNREAIAEEKQTMMKPPQEKNEPVDTESKIDPNLSSRKPRPSDAKTKVAKKPDIEPKPPRMSALDAAHQVLVESKDQMSCPGLIATMEELELWSSAKGKTPACTLHAAIMREINTKGKQSRFCKAGKGLFAVNV